MASQDSWARPLAKQLVDLFRVDSCDFIRSGSPTYDPATGAVTGTDTTYTGAAAVTKFGINGEGSVGKKYYLECWIDTQGVDDIVPTTDDFMHYKDRRWNIIAVDPAYSGDVEYAVKIRAES